MLWFKKTMNLSLSWILLGNSIKKSKHYFGPIITEDLIRAVLPTSAPMPCQRGGSSHIMNSNIWVYVLYWMPVYHKFILPINRYANSWCIWIHCTVLWIHNSVLWTYIIMNSWSYDFIYLWIHTTINSCYVAMNACWCLYESIQLWIHIVVNSFTKL